MSEDHNNQLLLEQLDQQQVSSTITTNHNNEPLLPSFNEKDIVEVPLNQFLTLLSSYKTYSNVLNDESNTSLEKEPPKKTIIQEMNIEGKTLSNVIQFQMKLVILVLVDKYTKCKLFDLNSTKLTIKNYKVQKEKSGKEGATTNATGSVNTTKKNGGKGMKASGEDLEEEEDLLLLLEDEEEDEIRDTYLERDHDDELLKANDTNDKNLEDNGFIGVFDNSYCLHTNEKGRYYITLDLVVPYLTDQKRSVELSFPFLAARNYLNKFEMDGDYFDVQIEPVTGFNTKFIQNEKNNGITTIVRNAALPPMRKLNIFWTRSEKIIQQQLLKQKQLTTNTVKKEEKKEEKQLNISVDQNVFHSIGGGLISSTTSLSYQIVNGSVNTFYILLQNKKSKEDNLAANNACPIRILRVDGRNIKQWEIKKLKNERKELNTPLPQQGDNQSESNFSIQLLNSQTESQSSFLQTASSYGEYFLKITLDIAVEGKYDLKIISEKDMSSESCKIHLPTFSCMNVNRDKGFIGVEGNGNVEINELRTFGLTKLAPTELPSEIISKASDALLFGYKFLTSLGNDVFLSVKKHDDVQVLIAVIEEAVYEITYSESGHLFYRVAMKVKNSSQTYMRVSLVPDSVENNDVKLYSTSVKGEVVRPAVDKDGKILIPLKRGTTDLTFSVELYYIINMKEKMDENGKVDIVLPRFNIPTSRAYFYVYLPNNYKYGEFEGSLKEVSRFDKEPTVNSVIYTDKNSYRDDYSRKERRIVKNSYQPRMQVQQMQQMPMMQMQQQAPMQNLNFLLNSQTNALPPQPQMASNIFNYNERCLSDDEEEEEELSDSESGSEDDDDFFDEKASGGKIQNTSVVSGVLPVSLNPVQKGKRFIFQKLLISENEDHLKLQVEFKKEKESFWTKRTLAPVKEMVFGLFGFIILIVLYILYLCLAYFFA
ncbi:hypothetical protein ABK040_011828 [Willaertia magna]